MLDIHSSYARRRIDEPCCTLGKVHVKRFYDAIFLLFPFDIFNMFFRDVRRVILKHVEFGMLTGVLEQKHRLEVSALQPRQIR